MLHAEDQPEQKRESDTHHDTVDQRVHHRSQRGTDKEQDNLCLVVFEGKEKSENGHQRGLVSYIVHDCMGDDFMLIYLYHSGKKR